MQPIEHLNHLTRLSKSRKPAKKHLHNPIHGRFHIVEDTVRVEPARFFLPLIVALYVHLGKDILLHVRQSPAKIAFPLTIISNLIGVVSKLAVNKP